MGHMACRRKRVRLIWDNMNRLLEKYGTKLDIIYDDPQFGMAGKYQEIYYLEQHNQPEKAQRQGHMHMFLRSNAPDWMKRDV